MGEDRGRFFYSVVRPFVEVIVPLPLMTICQWNGASLLEKLVESPAWEEVERAIRDLDGERLNDLYFYPDPANPEMFLAVCGGSGRYLVCGSDGNEGFPTFVDRNRPATPPQKLVAGGQQGDYPNNWVIDVNKALSVVLAFYEASGFSDSQDWEKV